MVKRSEPEATFIEGIKWPSQEESNRSLEKHRAEEEKRESKEKRDRHREFIQSGVRAGFTVRQVLWIIKHFSPVEQEHWDGRIGG